MLSSQSRKSSYENIVVLPTKKMAGKVDPNFYYGGLLSGRISKVHDVALAMIAFCEYEFSQHGIDTKPDYGFQKKILAIVESYPLNPNGKKGI